VSVLTLAGAQQRYYPEFPSWHGAYVPSGGIAQTYPRHMVLGSDGAALTSGTMEMVLIYLPGKTRITSITFQSGATALATGTNQWFALYDINRNLLRQTVDDTSTAWAANAMKTLALTSTYVTPNAGLYYLGIMVAATTVPTLRMLAGFTASGALNLAPVVCGASSTGLTTTAPNPAAAITVQNSLMFAYVS
jgi:hypothetical protein